MKRKTGAARPRRALPIPGHNAMLEIIRLRRRMDAGEISPQQFATLLQREAFRTEWTARVQLRGIARDLLPKAAALARKGRPRLLALLTKIFLTTETADIKRLASLYAKPRQTVLMHYIPRPQRNAEAKVRAPQPRQKKKAKARVVPRASGQRAGAAGPRSGRAQRVEVQPPQLERNSRTP